MDDDWQFLSGQVTLNGWWLTVSVRTGNIECIFKLNNYNTSWFCYQNNNNNITTILMTYIVSLLPKRCAVHIKFQNYPFMFCTISAQNPWFSQSLEKLPLANFFTFTQKLKWSQNATGINPTKHSAILIPHDTYPSADYRRTFAVQLPTIHRCATNSCIIQPIKHGHMSITWLRSQRW